MDWTEYLRFVLALCFVLGLIGLLAWIARRSGLMNGGVKAGTSHRLAVVEVRAVDAKRRLILVRRDDTEHLVLIGGATDIILETGISASSDGPS